ncbi:MAG: 3-methyl-2-oxobutanoate hydroxymethyltransferase [Anaerolineaceae bacterium 4572_78]|nr:MAG: 3-methyl-2-oxobutanoate hydroxymethyltransferase [Anaerolineaceae bacterium 4572_78]
MTRKKITILDLQRKKENSIPITMLTAYDYSSAILVDESEMDMILVGDSLGMVVMGLENTVPVTMDEMIHHCRMVSRGAKYTFLVGDMPFLSYEVSIAEAVRNAGRFLKEAGMDAVKLEGGTEMAETVRAIVRAGMPVMGHIGLTPQSVSKLGGFKVQGKTAESAQCLLQDALALEEAGCFSIVLEAVPDSVAQVISQQLTIHTIGIGAGAGCDGQVLVYHDMLGLFNGYSPKFVKQYVNLREQISEALVQYRKEVQAGEFPDKTHTYKMSKRELDGFLENVKKHQA